MNDLLGHVNCCYLSTRGHPPTLNQLKQHTQALTVLIQQLSLSSVAGEINAGKDGSDTALKFIEGETFDWLTDLTKPYQNEDPHHNMPLNALLNTHNEVRGVTSDVCPLHKRETPPDNNVALPYATIRALIRHANDILTRLDHEYSAKGGLLAIFPPNDDKKNRMLAENTVLGSLIRFTQNLVVRMHELEIQHANALDVLACEAGVPRQIISNLGTTGRAGRPVCYPQDRFVLANAGNDVWDFLNRELDRKDNEARVTERTWQSQGVMGDQNQGRKENTIFSEDAQSISYIDITTRYFRLRSCPDSKTIFVIPAHGSHPSVKATREMESNPTVVAVPNPYWPERASVWEENRKRLLAEAEEDRLNYEYAMNELEAVRDEDKVWDEEFREQRRLFEESQKEVARLRALLDQPLHEGKNELADRLKQVEEKENLIEQMRADVESEKEAYALALRNLRNELEEEGRKLEEDKRKMITAVIGRAKTADMNIRKRTAAIEKRERELGIGGRR